MRPALEIINHNSRGIRLLEIGSGCGTESLYFSLLGCDVIGIELMKQYYDVAVVRKNIVEKKIKNSLACQFYNLSIFDFCDEKKFGLIWMEQAFHHIEPRKELIDKVSNLLRPGGYLVISEANFYNIISQMFLFRERFRTHNNPFKTIIEYKDENGKLHSWGHERLIAAYKLAKLFEAKGIRKQSVEYFKFLPNRSNLKINSSKEQKKFFDNRFTQLADQFFNNFIPSFSKKPIAFIYNYVGIKTPG